MLVRDKTLFFARRPLGKPFFVTQGEIYYSELVFHETTKYSVFLTNMAYLHPFSLLFRDLLPGKCFLSLETCEKGNKVSSMSDKYLQYIQLQLLSLQILSVNDRSLLVRLYNLSRLNIHRKALNT